MSKRFCDVCPGTNAHNLSCPRSEYGQVVAPVDVADASADAPCRTVADVTDDEVVGAFVECFGMRGFDSNAEPMEPLAARLGVSMADDVFEDNYDALCARVDALEKAGRFCEDPRDGMILIVSPAEWGRRIVDALCMGESEARKAIATTMVTRILSGEREEASDGEG